MIGLDARQSLSFTTGLVAAINPCGFVLLPTYLMYFLGMENLRPGTDRNSVRRGLAVGLAVSAGFLAVFVVIGTVVKLTSDWFVQKAPWISLLIAFALIILGVAMLFGFRLPFTTPRLDVGHRDRSVVSMFVFGIAYAIASIGCTIGPFLGTVLGGVTADGIASGVVSIALYGLGMGLLVTGLTVTLALANTAMLRVLRRGMEWFEYVAGIFVLLTGIYLAWYWYHGISDAPADDRLIAQAENWQSRLATFVRDHQTQVVVAAVLMIAVAVAVSVARKRDAAAT